MALNVLYSGGYRDSLGTLKADDFTRNNNAGNEGSWSNDLITAETPRGVLAGHIAVVTGEGEYGVYDAAASVAGRKPKGIFILDAATDPFENQPALGSLKVAVQSNGSVVQVDVYETHDESDGALPAYAAGDPLYVSDNGLLTNDAGASSTQWTDSVGQVLSAPADGDATMTVELYI
jgi:hypothetical protein